MRGLIKIKISSYMFHYIAKFMSNINHKSYAFPWQDLLLACPDKAGQRRHRVTSWTGPAFLGGCSGTPSPFHSAWQPSPVCQFVSNSFLLGTRLLLC